MKTCKLKPDHNTCCSCLDFQIDNDTVIDCRECASNNARYTLLQIGTGFWSGDYAFVEKDGVIKKVPLYRVYDVKEEEK